VETLVDPERVTATDHRRGAAGAAVVASVWTALAIWRPTVTYHVAPLIVAAAWPYLLRRGPLRVANRDAARAAGAGSLVALVAAGVIVAVDAMRGPTLWGRGHAMAEVVPMALAGAVLGFRLARCGVAAEPRRTVRRGDRPHDSPVVRWHE
jgi:hypothetical protein